MASAIVVCKRCGAQGNANESQCCLECGEKFDFWKSCGNATPKKHYGVNVTADNLREFAQRMRDNGAQPWQYEPWFKASVEARR